MRVELTCDVRPDRDGQTPADSWPLPHTRVVKVFLPLFDVELSGGPSAVVPMTHRLPEKPQEVAKFLSKGSISGAEISGAGTISQEAMPNHLANKYQNRFLIYLCATAPCNGNASVPKC